MRIPIAAFFPVLGACLCLAACVSDTESIPVASEQTRWKQNQPARYSYTLEQKAVWISWKVRVSALRDSVVAVEDVSDPPDRTPVRENPQSYSIDSLFASIARAAKDDPKAVQATFNATFGYPESADFNGLPDTRSTLTISDFQVGIPP